MPKLKEGQLPRYRLHKQSGQAIVTLNGRDFLLGQHGSAASTQEYRRLTAEWLAGVGSSKPVTAGGSEGTTVAELVLAFWNHAQGYYRGSDGKPTTELGNFKPALKLLRQTYGRTRAAEFGPRSLKALLAEMIRLGWCRTNINRQLPRVKMVFKWGVANELVPAAVHHALVTVTGLRRGRSDAKESAPVVPVPAARIDAVLPHVSRQVRAMIELQLLTGMRPAEVCAIRGCDIDTGGRLWLYRPASHKTQHHGHDRAIYLGPKARAIVQPFMRPDVRMHLFSPADAEAERLAKLHARRKTPLSCGNVPGSNLRRKPTRAPRDHYTVASYRRAIARACQKTLGMPAELREPDGRDARAADTAEKCEQRRAARAAWNAAHVWHPHQLRHNAATRLRKDYGIEAAHSRDTVTILPSG